ncbi:MAG: sigma-54 dependent transcriptional regulator [Myxococcota bacterium]
MTQPIVRPPLDAPRIVHGMVTVAPEMDVFFDRLRRAARTPATVLIRGESGTGKELVAQALHRMSPRADRPFRAINCATLDRELLASELFGHVRGSFTGAVRDRTGLFQLADGGTVFLDEVAEMPLEVQARLLRVVQERKFVPLGGSDAVSVDVRIVSATHRALRREVEQRRFREDLMYRLRVVVLYLPRLAERTGDVEALTWSFVRELNQQGYRAVHGITREALDRMREYPWPGNVRELRNNLESAFALGEGPILGLDDLAPELRGIEPPESWTDAHELRPRGEDDVHDAEREVLIAALRAADGRKGEAAARLGMSRSTLWRKLRMLGIE